MDRSTSNQAGVCEHLPGAAITFDELHIIQLVNKAVAKTLKNHRLGFLNAFDARLTNGHVEAVNSLIQAAKAKPAATEPPST